METFGLLLAGVLAYSAPPLVLVARRTAYTFVGLYAYFGATLALAGILGSVAVIPLYGDLVVLSGQVAFSALMFTSVLATLVGRDVQVLRNIVALTVVVTVLLAAVFAVTRAQLASDAVRNPFATQSEVFDQSLRVVLLGGVLLLAELVLIFWVVEFAKKRLRSWQMVAVYPAVFVAVLVLDGALFPLLVLAPDEGLGRVVALGVQTKLVLAGAFVLPLLGYVLVARSSLARFEESPLGLGQLLSISVEELTARLDRQQKELDQERERVTQTTRSAGRATATVDSVLDAATDTILIALDDGLRITRFNTGARHALGRTSDDVLGKHLTSVLAEGEIDRLAAEMVVRDAPEQAIPAWAASRTRRDVRFVRADGSTFPVSLSLTEIVVDGEVLGYLAAGEDVRARVRAEQAVLGALRREHDAEQRLREAERVKHELVSTVSHELRTPLAIINGYAELLTDGDLGDVNGGQRDALERMRRSCRRLKELIDDLLLVEQLDQSPGTTRTERLDLRTLIAGCAEQSAELVRGRDLELDVEVPLDPVWVDADPAGLERVLVNLVSNAVKFTPGAGRIGLELTATDTRAELSVSDTGIGVSAEDQERLFSRFFRAGGAHEHAIQGSGLGLSIVHGVVLRHGGEVRVDSEPDRGTIVTVLLPLAG